MSKLIKEPDQTRKRHGEDKQVFHGSVVLILSKMSSILAKESKDGFVQHGKDLLPEVSEELVH